jgi:hypothetical protein
MSGREILLRARSHFRAARVLESLRPVAVPEWDTTLYFWPEMSVEERRAVFGHLRLEGGEIVATPGALLEAAVSMVCLRARDQFGQRLFSDADVDALRDTSPDVLQRIANEMGWGSRPTLEDAEKN